MRASNFLKVSNMETVLKSKEQPHQVGKPLKNLIRKKKKLSRTDFHIKQSHNDKKVLVRAPPISFLKWDWRNST